VSLFFVAIIIRIEVRKRSNLINCWERIASSWEPRDTDSQKGQETHSAGGHSARNPSECQLSISGFWAGSFALGRGIR
jgi:hypothetical protein